MFTVEPVWMMSCAAAVAAAAEFYALGRARKHLRSGWRAAERAQAMADLSRILVGRDEPDPLAAVVPILSSLSQSIIAFCPVSSSRLRAPLRVASRLLPSSADRAAVAMLAAHSLRPDEVATLVQALRSRLPVHGQDLRDILHAGESSLPSSMRLRLMQALVPQPYLAVPVVHAGTVVGLIIAAEQRRDRDLERRLARAAERLALLWASPSLVALQAMECRPTPAVAPKRLAPHGAELVLWLDAQGRVTAYERMQRDWALEPPASLGHLLRAASLTEVLEGARTTGEWHVDDAVLPDGTAARITVVPLTDVDDGLWGYAALLRRTRTISGVSGEPTPPSR